MLSNVYTLIAELWCNPQDVDMHELKRNAEGWLGHLAQIDPETTHLLAQFMRTPITEEEYIELFELNPRCPLYLGSHVFEEPKTCAQAAVSDRNNYMIELLGIYRHFGFVPNGKELPDYLPLMVEFLALTAGSEDPLREKFIRENLMPFLPPLRSRLEELGTPFLYLLDALERVLKLDIGASKSEVNNV
ncbi:Nitrate reductase molybdenum cofactor assembly chaperone NarJ [bacterium HR15]|nr:Nitrate reductase molybdenum cofactor assembly chaperone NarJ [bacterium HR15]